ncbi:MAG: hypothetical protein A2Z12_01265 [Actinobacteria bacterium RBG_16_68_21]|nr:MAG: hypothetical protein A2Z12_01265 [Actinobacteria bacterium RBG_16_68_21]
MTGWVALAEDRRPLAAAVGPFPHRPFLETWWRHRGAGEPAIVEHGDSVAAVVTHEGVMSYAGDTDVTDYHTPLGPDPGAAVVAAVSAAKRGTSLRFDSMPLEVARPVLAALTAAGIEAVLRRHEVTMVLPLNAAEPLAVLDGKERHEMRRKTRRFEETYGEPTVVTGAEGFASFVKLHRLAEGSKGAFMSDATAAFFHDLLEVPGAIVDVLRGAQGDALAAAFGFVDADTYYLYNSSFDPSAAPVSPGIVILKILMERESAAGRRRFDLLKGTETYKRRLGAHPRALYLIEGVV